MQWPFLLTAVPTSTAAFGPSTKEAQIQAVSVWPVKEGSHVDQDEGAIPSIWGDSIGFL
jgi:hypothetical protein